MAKYNFTVIIPTYTGLETISGCFDSILNQQTSSTYEVVVIIDGPNEGLLKITQKYQKLFNRKKINLSYQQFKENKGRFIARFEGAKLAQSDNILFLDDRITFDSDYFDKICKLNKDALIPNVFEGKSKNFVSRCLFLLRRKIYGSSRFGSNFPSYDIDESNFESSPKGTTSLWVRKKIFLDACKLISTEAVTNKYINDDTRLFRLIIDNGYKIHKSGKQKIYYQPRSKTIDEIRHLYHRGPRFVDYYLRPGSRYFFQLLLLTAVTPLLLAVLFTWPQGLLYFLIASLVINIIFVIALMEKASDTWVVFIGFPIILGTFLLGIYKGLAVWSFRKLQIV